MIIETVEIDKLLIKVYRWNPAKAAPDATFEYIDLSSVDKDQKMITSTTTCVGASAPSRAQQLVQNDDVLVSTVRPNLNGVAQVLESGVGTTASTGYCVLRPNPQRLDARYLFYWVKTPVFVNSMVKVATGANYPAVSDKDVKTSKIPLPPLEQQKRIAAILDKADELRAKRRRTTQKLDELLKSVFLEMFGDPVTNPKGWPEKELSSHLEFLTSGSRGWAQYYAEKGTLFLRIQNIGYNNLRLSDVVHVDAPNSAEKKRTAVKTGDVLLSITADLGRTAVIPHGFPPANINQHIALLRVVGILPDYLSAFLATSGGQAQFKRLNRQGVKAGLNFDDIKSLKILVPPKYLQQTYVEALDKIRGQKSLSLEAVNSVNRLFQTLQARAFSGDLTPDVLDEVEAVAAGS